MDVMLRGPWQPTLSQTLHTPSSRMFLRLHTPHEAPTLMNEGVIVSTMAGCVLFTLSVLTEKYTKRKHWDRRPSLPPLYTALSLRSYLHVGHITRPDLMDKVYFRFYL